jgi:hypothetical protein
MYPPDMSRTSTDAGYALVGSLEGDGVGEISVTYEGASERLVGLADPFGKAIGRPREAA